MVETRWKKASDLSKAEVWKSELWRHADDEPTREGAVKRLVKMLKDLIAEAETEGLQAGAFHRHRLSRRHQRGRLDREGRAKPAGQLGEQQVQPAGQPASRRIPQIGDHDTAVLMHNDGVVQGLSEVPFMQDVERWGVLTIGTGLGNARFTNRSKEKNGKKAKDDKKEKKSKD